VTLKRIDHSLVSNGRITSDLKKEDFEKMVDVFAQEVQLLEDQLIELSKQKDINTVTGIWLDYIGKLLGTPRQGLSDEEYRKLLKVNILSNAASGTPNQMIDIVMQYVSGDFTRLVEHPVAHGRLYTNGSSNLDKSLVSLVDDSKPAGTSWLISSDEDDNGLYLAWREYSQEVTQTNVYAEAGDPDMEAGSSLAEAGGIGLESRPSLSLGYDQNSLNGQNSLPYRSNIKTLNTQLGESTFQLGEAHAQLGNYNPAAGGYEFIRPLLWRVTEDSTLR